PSLSRPPFFSVVFPQLFSQLLPQFVAYLVTHKEFLPSLSLTESSAILPANLQSFPLSNLDTIHRKSLFWLLPKANPSPDIKNRPGDFGDGKKVLK
ncbi:MAG: hypothetical protein ACKO5Q_13650, partial [Microcystaceae cyanobacterium]